MNSSVKNQTEWYFYFSKGHNAKAYVKPVRGSAKPSHSGQRFQLQTLQSLMPSIFEDHHFLQVKSFALILTCGLPKIEELTQ